MFLQSFEFDRKSSVLDIVSHDYRTAEVFRKHGISYCCGGKWPMEVACEMKGIDPKDIQSELESATRTIQVSNSLDIENWEINFLMDYIIHVHHSYLKKTLPETGEVLDEFLKNHSKKFDYLGELKTQFQQLVKELNNSIRREEEEIFPYIRQIAHAHKHKEPYAALFIRTMRKPIENSLNKSHAVVTEIIYAIRQLTHSYCSPENACISQQVVLARLKELDNDLMQHLFLEQNYLFPKAISIEQEVLNQ